jgi:uncharacterized protein
MSSAASIPPPHLETAPDAPPPAGAWPSWPPIFAPAALLLGFGATLVLAYILFGIASAFGSPLANPTPFVTNLATILQDGCLIAAALFFASRVARPRPWQFGLRATRFWPALGWGVLTFAAFFVVLYVWTQLIGQGTNNDETAKALGANRDSVLIVALAALLTTVLAPFAEEFVFRGFMYGALRNWNRWIGAVIVGLLFGGVHAFGAPWQNLIPLAVLGFLLCLLRERTSSIYPGIGLHCANNSIAFGGLRHWGIEILPLFMASAALLWSGAILIRARWGP